jgi:chromatin structure-remodeling complex subunit SFH1
VTLIPIRIDLDIQPFRPDAPLPTPPNARDFGIDETLSQYRHGEITPQFRLKDIFLWNLHEALTTPDQFAKVLVDELDLPNDRKHYMVAQIAAQIRTQLEEYAGVALHPLFHSTTTANSQGGAVQAVLNGTTTVATTPLPVNGTGVHTPNGVNGTSNSLVNGTANGTANGMANGTANGTSHATSAAESSSTVVTQNGVAQGNVQASASSIPVDENISPDDTYRCIVSLNVNIMNRLYSDKFEWSLLHPPGAVEAFARQTCADLGLSAEWVTAIAHAIYEAVLRLKKEACENGGLVGYGELDNDSAEGVEAGWRYEPERLAEDWEPKVEILSKEEIDRREGDRERQIRRQRRETARFSSTANMVSGLPQSDYFANPENSDQPMGRGERSKKKRRFRSLSPSGRDTPEASGYGGGGGLLESYVQLHTSIIDMSTNHC